MSNVPRIAALVADGFQEEKLLEPRFALQLLGARVAIVSSSKKPIEIFSYFQGSASTMSTTPSTKSMPKTSTGS